MKEYPEQCVLSRETVQDIEDLLSGIVDMEIDSFEHEPSEDSTFLALAKIFSELAKLKDETIYWDVEGIDENGKRIFVRRRIPATKIWQAVDGTLRQQNVIGVRLT